MTIFSFPLPSGGEELRGAPLANIPDLVQMGCLPLGRESNARRSRHIHDTIILTHCGLPGMMGLYLPVRCGYKLEATRRRLVKNEL